MLKNLRTVNKWWETPTETSDFALDRAFQQATGAGSPISYFFQDIWIPVLTRDTNHKPVVGDDGNFVFTYKNVGLTTEQLADAYQTLYGYNKLSVPLRFDEHTMLDIATLGRKMKSIFQLNQYKYLKWIDSMGYAYNPLWNVDGSDSFQFIDEHGEVQRDTTPILQSKQELQTAPYDSENYRKTNQTETTYKGLQEGGNYYSVEKETHTGIPSLNNQEIPGTLHAVTGGDYSHIEKRVRQGNIGVTMTTQLISAERELVKFNLIEEFFRDINKQLLVGTYDGF